MVKVQNTSEVGQSISGHKRFEPNETRDVSKDQAAILARNPFMEIVESKKVQNDVIGEDKKNTKKATQAKK